MQKISPKYYKEISHILPLKKDKKQEEIHYPPSVLSRLKM